MKANSIAVFVAIAFLLLSCKKEQVETANISSFGFTGNSVNYKWDFIPSPSLDITDAYFLKTISANTNDSMYVLVGLNQASNIRLECAIHASKLKPSVYRTVTTMSDQWIESTCLLNGELYGTRTDDAVSVTINEVNRNYASGTFVAVMHDLRWGGLHELRIWNGYFNHVPIPD